MVSLFVPKFEPDDWVAILLLYYVSRPWIIQCKYWILVRPPAPACGPTHTSLRLFLLFVSVADHWSGAELTHPNFLKLASFLSRTRFKILFELWRQW